METRNNVATPAIVGVVALSVGAAAGFIATRWYDRKIIRRVMDELEKESEWRKATRPIGHFTRVRQTDEGLEVQGTLNDDEVEVARTIKEGKLHSMSIVPQADPTMGSYPIEVVKEYDKPVEPEVVQKHIFEKSDDVWNYEFERNHRERAPIYIIHRDEYMADEMEFQQDTVTYYEGDQVLVDGLDKPIYRHEQFIGTDLRFGHGSEDPNIVYIRNEREKMEFEVVRHTGFYLVEVEGLEIEDEYAEKDLRHSAVPMKFRRE